MKVRRHLWDVRCEAIPGQLSGNSSHPREDPLWDTELVKGLLMKKVQMSEEERKRHQRENSHRAYEKSKQQMIQVKTEVDGWIRSGKMTEEEGDRVLLSRLHGSYRLRYQKEITQREKEKLEKELEKLERDNLQRQQENDHLKAQNVACQQQIDQIRNYAANQTNFMSEIFNRKEHMDCGGHFARNGFVWPEEASVQAFWDIFAAVVPIGQWPKDEDPAPSIHRAYKAAALFLHPDKVSDLVDAIGSIQQLNEINAVFNESRRMIVAMQKASSRKAEFAKTMDNAWVCARDKVLEALRPKSTTLPAYYISHLVDRAAGRIKSSKE
jgi:hypothetical protein